MNAARLKEIMSHVEVQFSPQRTTLGDWHQEELREARFRARETHNPAAILPAEANCYIAHAKSLVIARLKPPLSSIFHASSSVMLFFLDTALAAGPHFPQKLQENAPLR